MTELRRTPLHRALYRPSLVLGGERELVMLSAAITGGLAFVAMNPVAVGFSLVAWPLCLFFLRMMAKADPDMSKVYLRNKKYAGYYPARSRHWRED